MGPSSNITHALNIVVKGITILYFLFCQTSVLLVEQIMHAIYFIYIYISITASKICYNDIGCFSNALPYITNLVCYTYFHWFFSSEYQHIFGKQTGYIFQSPKKIKTWTTKHYASLNQWYNTE